MDKIITLEQLGALQRELHSKNKEIVLAGGCFDILHIGHITFLETAKKQGDVLVILLESDEAIKQKKGVNRPIHSQKDRAHILSLLNPVDYIVLLPSHMQNSDYDNIVNTLKPAIIAATKEDPSVIHKQRQAKESGANLVFVNTLIPTMSTSHLVKILEQEM